jgi:hypothetical protein
LDNADDMEIFFGAKSHPSSVGSEQTAPLVNYLPHSTNDSVLITTRDKRVGERLTSREKAIMILPMIEQEAERLLLGFELSVSLCNKFFSTNEL